MYNLCLLEPEFSGFDLGAWRIGGYGGAPMPEATIARLAELMPGLQLMNLYGATETTSPATMMPAHHTAGRTDSVGLAVPCGELRIMDPAGREVAQRRPGRGLDRRADGRARLLAGARADRGRVHRAASGARAISARSTRAAICGSSIA